MTQFPQDISHTTYHHRQIPAAQNQLPASHHPDINLRGPDNCAADTGGHLIFKARVRDNQKSKTGEKRKRCVTIVERGKKLKMVDLVRYLPFPVCPSSYVFFFDSLPQGFVRRAAHMSIAGQTILVFNMNRVDSTGRS